MEQIHRNLSKHIKGISVRQENLTSLVCLQSAASVCAPRSFYFRHMTNKTTLASANSCLIGLLYCLPNFVD